ncbi:hypothetical protein LEP1GSC151_4156 [Leptospira interrogans serovar Grippotyphosa str. LT2186]|uniref:Uncharacterized protein n=1 Tax=Leptospira interrogans serovar Grippotyphosa str. LT2186 TaxID=1001599 RepID=M3HZC9_LEPIR|nr:hypothetical protein LEP1GSC151_4156 [Leptospira interrogans serovar Grippotyphosa str. LT2186]
MFLNRFTGMSLDKIDLFRARAGTGSLFPFLAALLMPFSIRISYHTKNFKIHLHRMSCRCYITSFHFGFIFFN